jgi:hypothetical protein
MAPITRGEPRIKKIKKPVSVRAPNWSFVKLKPTPVRYLSVIAETINDYTKKVTFRDLLFTVVIIL